MPNANELGEETDADEPRRLLMSYEEAWTPEELGEPILEVLGLSPWSRIEAG